MRRDRESKERKDRESTMYIEAERLRRDRESKERQR